MDAASTLHMVWYMVCLQWCHLPSQQFHALAGSYDPTYVADSVLCAWRRIAQQDGFGEFQVTQWNGRRADAFQTYLKPALGRENLQVRREGQAPTKHGSHAPCSCISAWQHVLDRELR
jgi:choline dehydrogenase-like flavoprotein